MSDVLIKRKQLLCDWLCEVAYTLKISWYAYYLAIDLINEILPHNDITTKEMQLFGCSCMHIATKFEDECACEVSDWIYLSKNSFNKENMQHMEQESYQKIF